MESFSSIKCTLNTDFYEIINFGSNSPCKANEICYNAGRYLAKESKNKISIKTLSRCPEDPLIYVKSKAVIKF